MPQNSPLVNKNVTRQETNNYLHTSMVSHRGTPVSFAMRDDGRIFYSVLDISKTDQDNNVTDDSDKFNDKFYWSQVTLEGPDASRLRFPFEIMQIGYGMVPNYQIDRYDSNNKKIINHYNTKGKPEDENNKELSDKEIESKTDNFYSSTARLGAIAPFQVLSDGKYIYVFRQSVSDDDKNNVPFAPVVDNTLLVDRFILSGTVLKLSREIRYQRSRHKTEPESRKDTLSAEDIEGNPFYEPTRELAFASNLSNGNFSVLLIPGAGTEEQRWIIFTVDSDTRKVNSFNIKFDYSIVFDTSDCQTMVDEFLEKYELDSGFVSSITGKIAALDKTAEGEKMAEEDKMDLQIAADLSRQTEFAKIGTDVERQTLEDALEEVVYIVRTGVMKDDFTVSSASEWPLMEYGDGGTIRSEYLKDGALLKDYAFHGSGDELIPGSSLYTPVNGISSCYYYQQETGPDGKPMKNKACVMLALGLQDKNENKFIGILNFSAAASGSLSRLKTDSLNMPDINVQALDENPYRDFDALEKVGWQQPQKMRLLDIDTNGLGTSGGVLKFAYTSAEIGESQGYSDAVAATDPLLFDDSLGKVNLYFKGKNKNFFVLYFNPTGSKSVEITNGKTLAASPAIALNPPLARKGVDVADDKSSAPSSALALNPRLDRDMNLHVFATVPAGGNTCTLTIQSQNNAVEEWSYLPKRFPQIADILNGSSECMLGTLEPLGAKGDPKAAYLKSQTGKSLLNLRTTLNNNLFFTDRNAFAEKIAGGSIHSIAISKLSAYLANNPTIVITNKQFTIGKDFSLKADFLYKSYLSGFVPDADDINKLWNFLQTAGIITITPEKPDQGILGANALTGNPTTLSTAINDKGIEALALNLLKDGNMGDKKARMAALKQSLFALLSDVSSVRLVSFPVTDNNIQKVDRLEAGLPSSVVYDYASHLKCTPSNLDGVSASKWEYAKSFLFNAGVNYQGSVDTNTEIDSSFNYNYNINNTIGQWEDWEASLALEFKPASAANGAALTIENENKLNALLPTEKGLSVEAWVKPSTELNNPGSVLCCRKAGQCYSLGIVKVADNARKYKCVATLGDKKYTSKNSFSFKDSTGNEQWRHLAYTHHKYWGYQLNNSNFINCGNDSSLQLKSDFTLEVLAKITKPGTLLEKKGEYGLLINSDNEVEFTWAGTNVLFEWVKMKPGPTQEQQKDTKNFQIINSDWHQKNKPEKLAALNQFYKITLIRSKNKPQSEPTKVEYPITGNDQENATGSTAKWYEGKNSDELIKGMAERQDQMENNMNLSQMSLMGTSTESSVDLNPKYYYTLIITGDDNSSTEWMSPVAKEVAKVEAYQDFMMGGTNFEGIFTSVRVWSRVLSKSEAKALPVSENQAGLLSQWRMAEGKRNYLYDNVGENHGVATGGNWADSPQSNRIGQFQFYVDGSPEAHDTTANTAEQIPDQLCIGGIKKGNGFVDHFKGFLEEIRVWNTARTNEQITDNAFGRLKGEWEQLLANYTFDIPLSETGGKVQDASVNSASLTVYNIDMVKEVLSTAPIATEIPQVRSALTGVLTEYNDSIDSRPAVVEYGDVQKNDNGTMDGILKRCYSFIDAKGVWNRMTGYKIGNLVSEWYGQAQFAPQVMGYMEGSPPVPAENFPVNKDGDVDTYAFFLNNSLRFRQAEEVSYNYSTSKEAGWKAAVESEGDTGLKIGILLAPLGFGRSFEATATLAAKSNWETSGKRSESYERGTSVNTEYGFSAALSGYDNGLQDSNHYYALGNTGFALVKSKTADLYLLRLAHNNALVSIFWQPNPDIPEDINIISFPVNPLYIKQGCLDGKFAQKPDVHYPQAQGAYGQYSYFKPREAYQLKKQIEREKMELKAYFEDSFDVSKTNSHFQAAAATTGIAQLAAFIPALGPVIASTFNQVAGQLATQFGYNNTQLKDDIAEMGSQRNLVNTYVWTVEGGFYSESTEVAETQQETYANETSLSLEGGLGVKFQADLGYTFEQKTLLSSGSSFTLTKSKTKESKSSFGLEVNVTIPTSPRYKYGGTDNRTLAKGLIKPGVVDAYRFMTFYLEPKATNFTDLFTQVIDPIWLEESPDPYAQALRQARGNVDKAKPCWRIMHRVTYVSRILPEFQAEAPPSLEKAMRVSGIESNYMLIKKFEPYVANIADSGSFFTKIEHIIDNQLPEFRPYKSQIKTYLALYFNMDQVK